MPGHGEEAAGRAGKQDMEPVLGSRAQGKGRLPRGGPLGLVGVTGGNLG